MIKLCIFDVDGLVLDSERSFIESGIEANRRYGFNIPDEYFSLTVGSNGKQFIPYLESILPEGVTYKDYIMKHMEVREEYIKKYPFLPKKGIYELLDYLEEKKIYKGVATSTPHPMTKTNLSRVDLYDRFDYVLCGDEVKRGKPEPDIYLSVLEKFEGIKKEETLIFEDSTNGILSANAAGIRVIYVPDVAIVKEDIQAKAFKKIDDLAQAIKIIEELNK